MLPASLVPATCPFAHSFLPFCRTSPYRLGEEFLYYPATSARPAAQARVLAIRGNLVVSLFLPDSALLPPGTEAALDSALDIMERRAVPLMQHVFNLATPTRTSDESGQLFIAFEQFVSLNASGAATWWPDPSNGHGRWGKVIIAITPNLISPFSNRVQGLLVHEVLHTYQFRWRYEHASPWRTYLGGWAVEGSTTLFVLEIEREGFGYAFLGDSMPGGYAIPDTDLWNSPVAAASFMRHLTQRLMENGLTYDDALREAVVGALEGWWGINEEGQARGLGITARMRRHLGPGWHPVDALLDWTLAQAADGLTTNPKYQNRTVRYHIAPFTLLQPHGTLSGTAPVQRLRTGGMTGVFQIDDQSGGSYAMSSTIRGVPTDAPEWMILRIR